MINTDVQSQRENRNKLARSSIDKHERLQVKDEGIWEGAPDHIQYNMKWKVEGEVGQGREIHKRGRQNLPCRSS